MAGWLKKAELLLESVDDMAAERLNDSSTVAAPVPLTLDDSYADQLDRFDQQRREVQELERRVDDARARAAEKERESARERGEWALRVADMQAALGERDLEVAKLQGTVRTLEARLARSATVVAQLRAPPAVDAAADASAGAVWDAQRAQQVTALQLQVAEQGAAHAELQAQLEEAHAQHGALRATYSERHDAAVREATAEAARRAAAEAEARGLRAELRAVRDETRGLRDELDQLRRRPVAASATSSRGHGSDDVERRVRQLTDALLAKQTALDAAHAERSALQLQLERAGRPWRFEHEADEDREAAAPRGKGVAPLSGVLPRRLFGCATQMDALYSWLVVRVLDQRPRWRLALVAYLTLMHVLALMHL